MFSVNRWSSTHYFFGGYNEDMRFFMKIRYCVDRRYTDAVFLDIRSNKVTTLPGIDTNKGDDQMYLITKIF